jgi:hypothetical protein
MKKLFVMVMSMTVLIAASAQYKGGVHYRGGTGYYRPHARVIVGVGAGYYPPYYYSPFYPFGYWGGPHYYRPSRLELKIEDIQADYKDRIYSARRDRTISKSERKATIHQLKSGRDLAIRDAERNYYRSS